MAKKVVLSFDDGRADTYEIAFPIIKKYGLTATLNVATDFILHPESYSEFKSALGKAMTIEQVQEMHRWGIEIASHGHRHTNSFDDINESLSELKRWGINDVTGFASPFSEYMEGNNSDINDLIVSKELQYIRTGIQVKRQKISYIVSYILEEKLHSRFLFSKINMPLCNKVNNNCVFKGISVSNNTKVDQIRYLIKKMPENGVLILILHSILPASHQGIGKDKWYWTKENFEELCDFLIKEPTVKVVKNCNLT